MFTNRRKSTKQASGWQAQLLFGSRLLPSTKNTVSFWWMRWLVWLFGLVFMLRLFELQVVQGNYHRERAEENRLVTRRIAASRGVIRDRSGEVLTRNIPTYKKLKEGTTLFQGQYEKLTREQALSLSDVGEWVYFDISREYLYGRPLSTVVGYIAEASQVDLGYLSSDYVAGDLIGKAGIEKTMEETLRGKPGHEYVEVNSQGVTLRQDGMSEPITGNDVTLTVDRKLSETMYNALDGYIGAAVALDPRTGEVLAMVTRPSYDPNDLGSSLAEENKPFFNRALSGAYPPGSIFKLVTLTAALEEGAVKADETITDTGEITINGFRFGNWLFDRSGGTDGQVNAVKALQRSNDIYFYKVGEALGPEKLAEWAKFFGLGSVTGLPLPQEIAGLVPDPLWRERETGDRWYLGNTYHMAIGQGDLQTTPMQMAVVTSVIANGGRLCQPKLILDGKLATCKDLGIATENIQVVMEGMKAVCQQGGTASRWSTFTPQVACKTGTAQFGGADSTKTHAWFTVFAPAENPSIVLTVLLEGAGEGSEHASPVALKILNEWLSRSMVNDVQQ